MENNIYFTTVAQMPVSNANTPSDYEERQQPAATYPPTPQPPVETK